MSYMINSISFIIPVYNEKHTLEIIIDRVEKVNLGIEKEIIIVDDYSTDGSREIIKNLSDKYKKIFHDKNVGKGAAIRNGVKSATGDLIIIQDADLEYNPEDIKLLLPPIINNEADVVYGSRFLSGNPRRVIFFWHMVGNKLLTMLVNMVSNFNFTDMETCYKLFRSNIIKNIEIEEDRFGFEPEITLKICRMNCRVYEVGISYYGRSYEQGKKINWKDGVHALRCILKYGIIRKIFDK
ncbi:MAG: glycosyltransferase family 2 protein [Candidatus Hydrogenedentota bacterium]